MFGEFHFSDRYYNNLRLNTLDFNIHFENLKLDWRLVEDSINGLVRINDSYIKNFECWHSIFKQSITLETTNIERFEIHHCSAVTLQSDWSDITNSFIIGESQIDNVEFSRVYVHSNVSIFADSINQLYFSLCDFDKDVFIFDNKICYLKIDGLTGKSVNIEYCRFDSIEISDSKISKLFLKGSLPKKIWIENLTIDEELDFENIISNDITICELGLYRLDFNKVKFDYKYFHYIQNSKYDYDENIYNMEEIKKIQKINEFEQGFHYISNEILEFKRKNGAISYFNYQFEKKTNLLFNWWSGYGIEKSKIFKNTGILFLLSYILIFIFFEYWIREVYKIEAINKPYNDYKSASEIKRICLFNIKRLIYSFFYRLIYSFFYTCLIFFGLKLTISNFDFKKKTFPIIIIIYLIGLFCTAYLVAFFLDKL